MNPFARFREFISYPSHGRTMGLLAFLIIVLAIPLTVNIAQKQQELRQRAAESCQTITYNSATPSTEVGVTCGLSGASTPGYQYNCYKQVCASSGQTAPQNAAPQPSTPAAPPTGGTQCPTGCTPLPPVCEFDEGVRRCEPGGCSCPSTPPAPPPPAPSAPAAPSATCDLSKGYVSACTADDKSKGRIVNGSCQRTCPAGTVNAGKTYTGVSYKECQDNLCWYDSFYDKTQSKINEGKVVSNGPGWCFPVPGTTDPCTVSSGVVCTCVTQGGDAVSPNNGFKCTDAPNTLRFCAANEKCLGPSTLPNFPCQQISTAASSPCTVENVSLRTSCVASACSTTTGNGTRTITKDSGSPSCRSVTENQTCTNAPPNCSSPNTCSNGTCTSQAQPPPTPGVVASGNIQLTFTLKLDGLGSLGDRDLGSQKNNPARKSRNVTVQLIQDGTTKSEKTGTLITSTLSTTIDMGALPSGTYTIKVKADGFLRRTIESSFSLESGKNNELRTLSPSLPNGDVNRDGTVNASDFSAMNLSTCFGKVATGDCVKSDLDDDGQVTLFDLNLLLREFGLSDE